MASITKNLSFDPVADITPITIIGATPMVQDIVGGQVDWCVGALPAVPGQIKAGNLCVCASLRYHAAPQHPRYLPLHRPGTPFTW